ncbi:cyclic nucleotide-binding domain-containing protein 2 [Tiliqua scincoides]|uniref:cyclic nucleotide-binding domain-containing protein 2 n=1 Tax=Tiliqua scincoides TaxID=71010 RepID=UPI003462ADEE
MSFEELNDSSNIKGYQGDIWLECLWEQRSEPCIIRTLPRVKIKNFHRLIVNIILMNRVCKAFQHGQKEFSGFELMKEGCNEIDVDKRSGHMAFGRLEFSVTKEHFPFRAVQITKKPPEWRTESEIRHLQNRMLVLESFRQYSPTLQFLLAKVIRFERFGRRRVIVRKGHVGRSFYFIYYGTVAVTNDEDGSSAFVESAPTLIHKGASFGEVALLKGTRRNATIVCMEETELLVVDKVDFFNYELDKELYREFRNRYEYLRTIDLFETMPDATLEKLAHFCKIERFQYGQVITNDITESTTVIFITKGVCEILRLVDLTTCPSYHKWLSKQLGFPKPKFQMTGRQPSTVETSCADRFKSTMWSSCSGRKLAKLKANYLHQPVNKLYEGFERQSSLFKGKKSVVINVETCDTRSFNVVGSSKEIVQNIVSGNKLSLSTSYGELPRSAAAAVYIRMDELRKGEYLANLQDTRPMALVSKGAEIIRFKKEKLEEVVDDATVLKLCQINIKYPSDDELCQVFLQLNAWEMFKKDLLNLVMKPKLMKMVHPPDPWPTDEIYDSWYVNQAGILDLTELTYKKKLPPPKYRFVPVRLGHAKETLPKVEPRLIHGIDVLRPSLNGAF